VLGHHRDPVHPFSDAGMLAEELPNGRLLEANSIVELRMQPERLTNEIAGFLDEVWAGPGARQARGTASAPAAAAHKRTAKAKTKARAKVTKAAKAPAKRAAKAPAVKRAAATRA
jgi:hypothetical protein